MDMMIRMHVVLPAPLGPMNPQVVPRGIAIASSSTARVVPKVFVRRSRRNAGSIDVLAVRLYHVV
jgi:hypothetical protein